MMADVTIFDIDGTLTIDTETYSSEELLNYQPSAVAAEAQVAQEKGLIAFCTFRHEGDRALTRQWLGTHVVKDWAKVLGLWMNPLDYRSGQSYGPAVTKSIYLDEIEAKGHKAILAWEDDHKVVDMYLHRGVPCMAKVLSLPDDKKLDPDNMEQYRIWKQYYPTGYFDKPKGVLMT